MERFFRVRWADLFHSHREAGKVAQAINAQQFSQAEQMMDANTPYATASYTAVAAIGVLKREAGV